MKQKLKGLMLEVKKRSRKKYNRVNPFLEDLTDWKEKGRFCTGKNNVTIYDSTTIIGDVQIEDNVWIGPFCILDGSSELLIGEYTSVATGCQILTHDTIRNSLSGGKEPYEQAPVSIGKCCFIGTHSIVLKGTTIGDHCLVSANSVVHGSFEDFSIIGGSPAIKIGEVKLTKRRVRLVYS